MFTLETLQDIQSEIMDGIQRLEDEVEQFDKYREEQFGEEDIDGVLANKKALLLKVEKAIKNYEDEDDRLYKVFVETIEDFYEVDNNGVNVSSVKESIYKKADSVDKLEELSALLTDHENELLKYWLNESVIENDMNCEREVSMDICEIIGKLS